jgi:hypothetical protein
MPYDASACRWSMTAFTNARPQLNAYRCPPQCDRNAASWAGVGSNANRYAWITLFTETDRP